MGLYAKLFRSGHAYDEIRDLLSAARQRGEAAGLEPPSSGRRLCLDLPAGTGVNSPGIREAGYEPVAGDLYPEEAHEGGTPAVRCDFTRSLPFADGSFDAVLTSEGIEHHPAQSWWMTEFARVLRPGGAIVITTPNIFSARARLSTAFNTHYSFRRIPISEVTGIWGERKGCPPYLGHVHMIGYPELRFILAQAGLRVTGVSSAKWSVSSVLIGLLMWLPCWLNTRRLYRRFLKKHPHIADEITRHSLSADLMFGKKLIVCAEKVGDDRHAVIAAQAD